MINKCLKEYVEKEVNKQKIYNSVLSETKGVSKMKILKNNFLKLATTVAVVALLIITVPKIKNYYEFQEEFKRYKGMPKVYGIGRKIDEENVEMEYAKKDDIEIKINSIIATPDKISISASFKTPGEKYSFDKDMLLFDYVVYDDDNNIYQIFHSFLGRDEIKDNSKKIVFKELGLEFKNNREANEKIIADLSEEKLIDIQDDLLTYEINIETVSKEFPKTRKLNVAISDLRYVYKENNQIKAKDLSDAKWLFEVNIPDKYYYSTAVDLKLEKDIEDFKIKKATISDTGVSIIFSSKYIFKNVERGSDNLVYITDENNNRYDAEFFATSSSKTLAFRLTSLTKEIMKTKKLYLNVVINDITYTSELLEK